MADLKNEIMDWGGSLGVNFRYKDESLLMKLLGKILFFNKRFMTSYTTTIGDTVYFPTRKWLEERNPKTVVAIVAHEVTHIMDNRRLGTPKYVAHYLSPQIGALGAFGALSAIWVGPWGLLPLLCLACLAPWGSKGRSWLEMRGYATSLAVWHWFGHRYDKTPDWITKQFAGPSYYYMCRDKLTVQAECRTWLDRIKSGYIVQEMPWLAAVKATCERNQ